MFDVCFLMFCCLLFDVCLLCDVVSCCLMSFCYRCGIAVVVFIALVPLCAGFACAEVNQAVKGQQASFLVLTYDQFGNERSSSVHDNTKLIGVCMCVYICASLYLSVCAVLSLGAGFSSYVRVRVRVLFCCQLVEIKREKSFLSGWAFFGYFLLICLINLPVCKCCVCVSVCAFTC